MEHVHTGYSQAENLCAAHGRLCVLFIELDRFGDASAVYVTAEFLALGHPPHGRDHLVPDHEGAYVKK